MALFTYQRRCLDQVAGHHKNGKVRVLVVSPTGSGKGHMAAHLIRECIEPHRGGAGKRALFIVHSRDIVRDMADRLRSQGVASVGVLMGGTVGDASAMVQVCTVQSLARVKAWAVDLVIVDEAHHYPRTSNWAAAARRFKARRVVGFTATPERRDGSPLGGKRGFEEMVVAAQYSELMAQEKPRVLAPKCRVMIPEHPVGKGRAMTPDQAYLRYAKGRFAFVYAANTAEVPRVTSRLKRAGIKAVAVLGTTDKDERDRAISDLRAGRIHVIVNFETMTEGVDCPRVDTVVVGRRVTHVGKWIQMAGRAMRHYEGKAEALVLDCSGSYTRPGFGNPSADRAFSLTDEEPIRSSSEETEADFVVREYTRMHPGEAGEQLVDASTYFVGHGRVLIPKDDPDIGNKPDSVVAAKYGVCARSIMEIRKANGIAATWYVRLDKPALAKALRSMGRRTVESLSAKELGKRLRISPASASVMRRAVGWSPARAGSVSLDRVRAAMARTNSIQQLADRLGVAYSTAVGLRRKATGAPKRIPGVRARPLPGKRANEIRDNDERYRRACGHGKTANQIARESGLSFTAVKNRMIRDGTWIEPAAKPVYADDAGSAPDYVVARKHGVDKAAVWAYRKRNGIPPHMGRKAFHQAAE